MGVRTLLIFSVSLSGLLFSNDAIARCRGRYCQPMRMQPRYSMQDQGCANGSCGGFSRSGMTTHSAQPQPRQRPFAPPAPQRLTSPSAEWKHCSMDPKRICRSDRGYEEYLFVSRQGVFVLRGGQFVPVENKILNDLKSKYAAWDRTSASWKSLPPNIQGMVDGFAPHVLPVARTFPPPQAAPPKPPEIITPKVPTPAATKLDSPKKSPPKLLKWPGLCIVTTAEEKALCEKNGTRPKVLLIVGKPDPKFLETLAPYLAQLTDSKDTLVQFVPAGSPLAAVYGGFHYRDPGSDLTTGNTVGGIAATELFLKTLVVQSAPPASVSEFKKRLSSPSAESPAVQPPASTLASPKMPQPPPPLER